MLTGAKNVNPIEECVRYAKGRFLASGASGILEISPCGDVMKSPWPGQYGEDSRRDITIENEIYRKLGRHPRLIRIVDWNLKDCVLTMEYMPNSNLQAFLVEKDTTEIQRLRWVQEAAEGVQLLHDADVLCCDINPKNFLLDARLGLKIADFGGSSTVQYDLFALGTNIYFIMTCQLPFPGLLEDEVEETIETTSFLMSQRYHVDSSSNGAGYRKLVRSQSRELVAGTGLGDTLSILTENSSPCGGVIGTISVGKAGSWDVAEILSWCSSHSGELAAA